MTFETSPDRLRADLKDPLFTCYAYVGKESDVGWQNAVFVHGVVTQLNIYLFEDHTHLTEWIDDKKPRGIAFGWTSRVHKRLNKSEADDLGVVLVTITEAQET
jgi:hypothetical protein